MKLTGSRGAAAQAMPPAALLLAFLCACDSGLTATRGSPLLVPDLAVADTGLTSVTLQWTAPGADRIAAARYDIRYALSPITADDQFTAASPVGDVPSPQPAGAIQSMVVPGLAAQTRYWFAMKTEDSASQWSALSNSPSGMTLIPSSALVFNDDELNDFRLTMDPSDWDSIIRDTRGDEWRATTVQWKDITLNQAGVRPSGEFHRYPGNQKMSLRFKFNAFVKGQRLCGLENLKLDGIGSGDGSMMRERLGYGLYRGRIDAPRETHCRLFVNGEYRGLYYAEERVDEDFVEGRFGGTLGYLYKILNANDSYAWRGSSVGDYVPSPWEPHTYETVGDHGHVVDFLDVVNHDPAALGTACDLETLISFLAVQNIIGDPDSLTGTWGTHNHYQYYRLESGLFIVVPWDVAAWQSDTDRSIFQNFQGSVMTAPFENDPVLRNRYKERIREIIANEGAPARLADRIDFIYAQIREASHEDPNKGFDNSDFDEARYWLKQRITARNESLLEQLDQP